MMGRVLVVDPQPMVREYTRRRLAEAGFETRLAACAGEALEPGLHEGVDVVLLAVCLPDGNGFEVLEKLRALPSLQGVSIALLATERDSASLGRGLELGADDYLHKPLERVELIARVTALTRLRRHLAELQLKNARLNELNEALERMATHDGLTGLANRRYLETRLAEEVERASRYHQTLSVVMLDVDHFKRVNDTFGHAAGDGVLRALAGVVGSTIRKVDLAARYGGEEFVVLAPSTDPEGACTMAERIRVRAASSDLPVIGVDGQPAVLHVTVSLGVATFVPDAGCRPQELHGEDLLRAADDALYRAKHSGRNRVERARGGA